MISKRVTVFALFAATGVLGLTAQCLTHSREKTMASDRPEAKDPKRTQSFLTRVRPPRQQPPPIDPARVPKELRALIPYVEKWGEVHDDLSRLALEEKALADQNAMKELKAFGNEFTPQLREIFSEWEDREPITKCHETAKFYFAIILLSELELISADPNDLDTVENHIRKLGKCGSYRKASGRMWAARFLADHGKEAGPAIPTLKKALSDEDSRVRVWAHYALWLLEGKHSSHIDAIAKELKDENQDGCWEAEAALEKIGPDAKRSIPALIAKIDEGGVGFQRHYEMIIAALVSVGRKDKRVRQTLQRLSKSERESVREKAQEALESAGK